VNPRSRSAVLRVAEKLSEQKLSVEGHA